MIPIRRTPRTMLLTSLAAIALYILAFGPIAWFIVNVRLPGWITAMIATVYAPLNFIPTDWLRVYIGLWCDLSQRPKTSPALPDIALGACLAFAIGTWLVWNFVGWFTRGDPPPDLRDPI